MFLVEYDKGRFINAENVDRIQIDKNIIKFTLSGDKDSTFTVEEGFISSFLNCLQALNGNIHNVEHRFHEINKGE